MRIAVCSECGCPIEVVDGEDWAYCPMCENDQVEIVDYKKQIKILEKALELSCRTMLVPDGYCEDIECPNVTCKDCLVEHFKNKAKEMKSE